MEKKSNWQEYKTVLDEQKIAKLYHFTDRDNLESIIKNGGLYSWMDCERKGIKIVKPGGGSLSRQLDSGRNLEDYVRVSFTTQHPMMFVAMKDGRISNPVVLEIDPEVILWKGTCYSDMNATTYKIRPNIGETISDFKKIHFQSVKARKHFAGNDGAWCPATAVRHLKRLRRRALAQTQKLDRLIARAPRSGCIFQPKIGYQTPAASGISSAL